MKCIIIEDQAPAQRILQKYINNYGSIELKATFTDAIQALEFLKQNEVHLIFLDIHLPKLSGVDFLKSLQNPPTVIFTTAFPDFALQGYELNVVDYLLKPFSFARFLQAMSKVSLPVGEDTNSLAEQNEAIFIKSGFEHFKVDVNDIFYIHSDNDYTEINTLAKRYLSSESLKHWENLLDEKKFIRVHRSYIINVNCVSSISANDIHLNDDIKIPIGRAYKNKVQGLIESF